MITWQGCVHCRGKSTDPCNAALQTVLPDAAGANQRCWQLCDSNFLMLGLQHGKGVKRQLHFSAVATVQTLIQSQHSHAVVLGKMCAIKQFEELADP